MHSSFEDVRSSLRFEGKLAAEVFGLGDEKQSEVTDNRTRISPSDEVYSPVIQRLAYEGMKIT
jgi:hypothetical protein